MSPISKSLLKKYLRGECTAEEEAHVRHWFDLNDAEEYPPVMSRREYAQTERRLWLRLRRRLYRSRVIPLGGTARLHKLLPYAAAILLLATVFFIWRKTGTDTWGHSRVYSVGAGEIKRVSLPDGTVVLLNSMSELRTPSGYGKGNRSVYLQGEAYFLVAEDSLNAFTVYSNDIATTALGTMFNVSAYPGEEKVVVSLSEGKVAVNRSVGGDTDIQQLVLWPGEEAVCPGEGGMMRQDFNAMERLGWKDRVIYFEGAGLTEVIRKLERYYGVSFDYRELEGERWELTGEYRQASLKAVLESLSFNYGIKYEMNNNEITLSK